MGSLIVKDFVSTVKGIGFMLMFYVGFSLVTQFPVQTYLIMGVFTFATQAAYLEEKNNTLLLMKILPLKASTIVVSKYLATLLAALLYTLIGFVDMVLIRGSGAAVFMDLLFGIFVMIAMMGLFLLNFFKSGYSKSSQLSIFLFMTVFVVMMIPTYMPDFANVLKPVQWLFLYETWSPLQMLGMGVLMVGLFALSGYFAIQFFQKRENF